MATSKTAKTIKDSPDNQPSLTYEQARDELIDVVNRLESGGENLADSMALFSRGEFLAGLCESYLADARTLVEETNPPAC